MKKIIHRIICWIAGHKSSNWQDTYWAPGHLGLPAKFCVRCGKVVKEWGK